jgi:hypothetical protein
MPDTITIAGRKFHGITQELSAAQDDYLMGQLRLAGALEIFTAPAVPGTDVPAEELAESLLTRLLVSGRAAHVLAGCLTPEGESWSVEAAEQYAKQFSAITDPADKLIMRGALVAFVLGFFKYARASMATFPSSSSPR